MGEAQHNLQPTKRKRGLALLFRLKAIGPENKCVRSLAGQQEVSDRLYCGGAWHRSCICVPLHSWLVDHGDGS